MVKVIKCGNENTFFAAANSGRGFVSFYGDIFGDKSIERRYLIKGGPGTGKSTLLKQIAQKAKKSGHSVDIYLCSSDPSSLDGVVIDGKTAILDATAPHSLEVELAGARDELVDLGAFWNSDGLFSQSEEIKALSKRKSDAYKEAYSLLLAVREIEKCERSALEGIIDRGRIHRYAERLARALPKGGEYKIRTGLCNAIGMKGEVALDTYAKRAERIYLIKDIGGYADDFLKSLLLQGEKRKSSLWVSYRPLEPTELDAVFFEDAGVLFATDCAEIADGDVKRIDLKRFADAGSCGITSVQRRVKEYSRLKKALLQRACESLGRAGEYHFALEEIYKGHMDLAMLGAFCDAFCERIVNKINI